MTTRAIKVLIADDESIVRKGLRSTVPWEKYGMEVVADAPNGRKAWEAFEAHRPEVVITDIVMPEMDGIELSRKVKEAAPDTKIILLSCHRDFEYAQQGMRLGASGYLLKTAFEDEELESMLAEFQRELSAAVPNETLAGQQPGDERRLSTLLYAWLNGHSEAFVPELTRLLREETPHSGAVASVESDQIAGQGAGQVRHAADSNGRKNADAVAGDNHVYAYIRPLYIYQLKMAGACESCEGLNPDSAIVLPYGGERCYWVLRQDEVGEAEEQLVSRKSHDPKLRWAKRGPLADTEAVLEAIAALHKEAEIETAYGVRGDEWPESIWKAVRLLNDNPAAEWSVSEVAGMVGLSRSHFSILFKKTLGDSFVAFQYKRKLRIARSLLAETSLTMQEIAERTGLSDSKYFSKWFKRCTGQTPSHYRARQKSEGIRTE